jgi:hypothetical protein
VLQSFFGDSDAAPLEFIAYQLKVDLVITTKGLWKGMRGPKVVTDTSSVGTIVSLLSQDHSKKGGVQPGLQQQDARWKKRTRPVCCALLQEDIQRAGKACVNQPISKGTSWL